MSHGERSPQGSFQHQHLNWTSKFHTRLSKISLLFILKGNPDPCSISLPRCKVRRRTGREEEHRASLQDQSHPVRAGHVATPQHPNKPCPAKSTALALGSCGCSRECDSQLGTWPSPPGPGAVTVACSRSPECQAVILPCCLQPLKAKLPPSCSALTIGVWHRAGFDLNLIYSFFQCFTGYLSPRSAKHLITCLTLSTCLSA